MAVSWQARSSFGQEASELTYASPFGKFTLPTVDGTAGILGTDYELARFAFGIRSLVPDGVDDLASDTGNGFNDRYSFENLDAFPTLEQPANLVGDLDTLDDANRILTWEGYRNPGFRYIHLGRYAMVWRVGDDRDDAYAQEVTIFPSLDHLADSRDYGYGPYELNPPPGGLGNVVLEAARVTVFGTNDLTEAAIASQVIDYFGQGGTGKLPNDKWFRASLTKVFTDGYKDYNGKSPLTTDDASQISPQEGDDFASQWQFRDEKGNPIPVKFVAVYANRTRDEKFYRADEKGLVPGNFAVSDDAKIDAVGFKRYVKSATVLIGMKALERWFGAAWSEATGL